MPVARQEQQPPQAAGSDTIKYHLLDMMQDLARTLDGLKTSLGEFKAE
jgi:hypothetical protein